MNVHVKNIPSLLMIDYHRTVDSLGYYMLIYIIQVIKCDFYPRKTITILIKQRIPSFSIIKKISLLFSIKTKKGIKQNFLIKEQKLFVKDEPKLYSTEAKLTYIVLNQTNHK